MALLLQGCIAYNTPGDVALKSIELVDWRNTPELPGPGASPLLGLVPRHVLAGLGHSVDGGDKPHREMLKIEFTSAMDLAGYASRNSYPVGAWSRFCGQERRKTLGFPGVFSNGNRLGYSYTDTSSLRMDDATTLFTYYTFVYVSHQAVVPSNPPDESHDLRQMPRDICFDLAGGNQGFGYRSNTVIVPAALIADVLRRTPAISRP